MPGDPPDFPAQISAACHDLRTPLASAYGFARTLERLGAVEGEHARYLAMVVEASEELGRLIDCLALVARAQDGRLVLERTAIGSHDLAGAALDLVPGGRFALVGTDRSIEVDAPRATSGLAWLAEAVAHAVAGEAALELAVRDDGAFALGPLPEVVADRFVAGTGDLRALGALAVARAHGGSLAREDDRIVLALTAT